MLTNCTISMFTCRSIVSQYWFILWQYRSLKCCYIVTSGVRLDSIAVLHQWFGLWSGSIGRSERTDAALAALSYHTTLCKCTLSCANVPCLVQMYLVLCKCNLSCARVPCGNVTILFLDLMLSHHNTLLYILPSLAHFVELPCIIGSEGLPWRLCRIPAGIPASVTPSRALCPLQS